MKWVAILVLGVAILVAVAAGGIYAASDEVCRTTGTPGGTYDRGEGFGGDLGEGVNPSTLKETCTRKWPWED